MTLNNIIPHEGYVPAYQSSAIPYVTSSQISLGEVHVYTFKHVTRFFNVKNRGSLGTDEVAVSFTQNGLSTGNYFTLGQGEAFSEELRCVQLFVSGSSGTNVKYEIVAGLTCIPFSQFRTLTGSNGYQGVG